jgi:hypothetical protein
MRSDIEISAYQNGRYMDCMPRFSYTLHELNIITPCVRNAFVTGPLTSCIFQILLLLFMHGLTLFKTQIHFHHVNTQIHSKIICYVTACQGGPDASKMQWFFGQKHPATNVQH